MCRVLMLTIRLAKRMEINSNKLLGMAKQSCEHIIDNTNLHTLASMMWPYINHSLKLYIRVAHWKTITKQHTILNRTKHCVYGVWFCMLSYIVKKALYRTFCSAMKSMFGIHNTQSLNCGQSVCGLVQFISMRIIHL